MTVVALAIVVLSVLQPAVPGQAAVRNQAQADGRMQQPNTETPPVVAGVVSESDSSNSQSVVTASAIGGAIATDVNAAEIENVTVPQLRKLLQLQPYIAVPLDLALRIAASRKEPDVPAAVLQRPRIREAIYRARLAGSRLVDGTLSFQVYPAGNVLTPESLMLGTINLTSLKVFDGDDPVTVAADAERRIFLLKSGVMRSLLGTWSIDGGVTGDVTTFRLELPDATTSVMELDTAPGIVVASANAMVLGPELHEGLLRWKIFPNVASRLILTCRVQRLAAAGVPMSLTTLTESHSVSGDTLVSRWALGLPSDLQGRDELLLSLPANLRVNDVQLNDNQSLRWSVVEKQKQDGEPGDEPQAESEQLLRIGLPRVSGTITLQATSPLATTGQWAIPLLKPLRWSRNPVSEMRSDGSDSSRLRSVDVTTGAGDVTQDAQILEPAEGSTPVDGPVLMPTSQVSVMLPPEFVLDGWYLSDAQELDVISAQDGTVIYQLARFVRDAGIIARVSGSQSLTAESAVSIVDQTGRLVTANCLINVRSEQGVAADLNWSVNFGWDIVAVRYASNNRAVFFEFTAPENVGDLGKLQVHLPEPLDEGASRVLRIIMQQSDLTGDSPSLLPLSAVEQRQRPVSYLVMAPTLFGRDSVFGRDIISSAAVERLGSVTVNALLAQNNWISSDFIPQGSVVADLNSDGVLQLLRNQASGGRSSESSADNRGGVGKDEGVRESLQDAAVDNGTMVSDLMNGSVEKKPSGNSDVGFSASGQRANRAVDVAEITCNVDIEGTSITEATRIVFPADSDHSRMADFLVADVRIDSMQWAVNGQPVEAFLVPAEEVDSGWQHWRLELPNAIVSMVKTSQTVVECEARRQLTTSEKSVVAFPENWPAWQGNLILTGNAAQVVDVQGLKIGPSVDAGPLSGGPLFGDPGQVAYQLPAEVRSVQMVASTSLPAAEGLDIDAHVFHMFSEQDQQIYHQLIGFAELRNVGGLSSLTLNAAYGKNAVVSINGRRVALLNVDGESRIPLPADAVVCHLLVSSNRRSIDVGTLTATVPLVSLFAQDSDSLQTTHHLLVCDSLQIRSPAARWQTSAMVDVLSMYHSRTSDDSVPATGNVKIQPAVTTLANQKQAVADGLQPLRSFAAEWRLGSQAGWNHRTVSGNRTSGGSIQVVLTSHLLKRVIQYSVIVVTLAVGYVLSGLVFKWRYRLLLAAFAVTTCRWLVMSDIQDAVLAGLFWGVMGSLCVSMIRNGLPAPGVSDMPLLNRQSKSQISRILGVCLLLVHSEKCHAQPPAATDVGGVEVASVVPVDVAVDSISNEVMAADVLRLKEGAAGSDLAYVRESVWRAWLQRKSADWQTVSDKIVVISADVEVDAHALDDVEVVLNLRIAAAYQSAGSMFSVDLRDSRLVECRIDGQLALPTAAQDNRVDFLVPSSVTIKSRPLRNVPVASTGSSAERSAAVASEATDEISASDAFAAGVEQGPLILWDEHQMTIRIRPHLTAQSNGVSFQIPAIPCPAATVAVRSNESVIERVFVQSEAGTREWNSADEAVSFGGLAIQRSLEIRLFASADSGNPETKAEVQSATICEMSAGQQLLTTICHVSQWNPLVRNIYLPVPDGYRLLSVGCAQASQLYWSVTDGVADIELKDLQSSSLFLELRFVSERELPPGQHWLRVSEFGAVKDCRRSADSFVAIRTTLQFSVQQIGSETPVGVSQSTVPVSFSPWIRSTDILFSVPSSTTEIRLGLSPQAPLNEVRVVQDVKCLKTTADWSFVAYVETFFAPVFRHQLRVDPSIEVTEVQVFAGEANRLDKFRQRDDRLMVMLKEGTMGPHRVVVRGRQRIGESDEDVRLIGLQLLNTPVLESSLTIEDVDGSDFAFQDIGTSVPDRRLELNEMLVPGKPVRFQVREDGSPIVLRRQVLNARKVQVHVVVANQQGTVFIRVDAFPGSPDLQKIRFAPDAVFITPPSVMVAGQQVTTLRRGDEFQWTLPVTADESVSNDVVIVYSLPVPETSNDETNAGKFRATAPAFMFDPTWVPGILVKADFIEARRAVAGDDNWSNDFLAAAFGQELSWIKKASDLLPSDVFSPADVLFTEDRSELASTPPEAGFTVRLVVADGVIEESAAAEIMFPDKRPEEVDRLIPVAVSATTAFAARSESVMAETSFVVYSPEPYGRIYLQIPDDMVITKLTVGSLLRPAAMPEGFVVVDVIQPVTKFSMQWMGPGVEGDFWATKMQIRPPVPLSCDVYSFLTVRTASAMGVATSDGAKSMDADLFNLSISKSLIQGLQLIDSAAAMEKNNDDYIAAITAELAQSRDDFFSQFIVRDQTNGSSGSRQFLWNSDVVRTSHAEFTNGHFPRFDEWPIAFNVSVGRIPSAQTLTPFVAVLLLLAAMVMRTGSRPEAEIVESLDAEPLSSVVVPTSAELAETKIGAFSPDSQGAASAGGTGSGSGFILNSASSPDSAGSGTFPNASSSLPEPTDQPARNQPTDQPARYQPARDQSGDGQLPDDGAKSRQNTVDGKPVQAIGDDQFDQPAKAEHAHDKADQSAHHDGQ